MRSIVIRVIQIGIVLVGVSLELQDVAVNSLSPSNRRPHLTKEANPKRDDPSEVEVRSLWPFTGHESGIASPDSHLEATKRNENAQTDNHALTKRRHVTKTKITIKTGRRHGGGKKVSYKTKVVIKGAKKRHVKKVEVKIVKKKSRTSLLSKVRKAIRKIVRKNRKSKHSTKVKIKTSY